MLESHLMAGNQKLGAGSLTYGQSITDACLGFEETQRVLRSVAEGLA